MRRVKFARRGRGKRRTVSKAHHHPSLSTRFSSLVSSLCLVCPYNISKENNCILFFSFDTLGRVINWSRMLFCSIWFLWSSSWFLFYFWIIQLSLDIFLVVLHFHHFFIFFLISHGIIGGTERARGACRVRIYLSFSEKRTWNWRWYLIVHHIYHVAWLWYSIYTYLLIFSSSNLL